MTWTRARRAACGTRARAQEPRTLLATRWRPTVRRTRPCPAPPPGAPRLRPATRRAGASARLRRRRRRLELRAQRGIALAARDSVEADRRCSRGGPISTKRFITDGRRLHATTPRTHDSRCTTRVPSALPSRGWHALAGAPGRATPPAPAPPPPPPPACERTSRSRPRPARRSRRPARRARVAWRRAPSRLPRGRQPLLPRGALLGRRLRLRRAASPARQQLGRAAIALAVALVAAARRTRARRPGRAERRERLVQRFALGHHGGGRPPQLLVLGRADRQRGALRRGLALRSRSSAASTASGSGSAARSGASTEPVDRVRSFSNALATSCTAAPSFSVVVGPQLVADEEHQPVPVGSVGGGARRDGDRAHQLVGLVDGGVRIEQPVRGGQRPRGRLGLAHLVAIELLGQRVGLVLGGGRPRPAPAAAPRPRAAPCASRPGGGAAAPPPRRCGAPACRRRPLAASPSTR